MAQPEEQRGPVREEQPQDELLALVRALRLRVDAARHQDAERVPFRLNGATAAAGGVRAGGREGKIRPGHPFTKRQTSGREHAGKAVGHPGGAKPEAMTVPAHPLAKVASDAVQEGAAAATAAGRSVSALPAVRAAMGDCRRCPLGGTRRNLVFGEGNPRARIVFVGEAPGADEDQQGRPFVGRAGQLLTRIIGAMTLSRSDVYICNILKCRPPGNRNPLPAEIDACEPFLIRQLAAIGPEVICALGTFAARTLLKTDVPITLLRGRFHSYQGIAVMPTYHPAYLLRNPEAKKQVWDDMQMVMKRLDIKP
jgi:uracil-DNA glycosylase